MADYMTSLKLLLLDEGGYVNDPRDAGAETYAGVSRRYHGDWRGWVLIDAHKAAGTCHDAALAEDAHLQTAVADFYRRAFWRFDALPQAIADRLLPIYVLHGMTGGAAILTQALARIGLRGDPMALAAKAPVDELTHALRAFAALAIYKDVLARPSQEVFLAGWLWRATA